MNKYEQMRGMKAEHWSRVAARDITPFTIDKVEGHVLDEWDRTGRSLPICDYKVLPVVAWDLRHPDGTSERFVYLRDAKARAKELLAQRR